MKILNMVIALLVLSIIVSAGFLGYSYYAQNTKQEDVDNTPNGNGNNIVDNNPIIIEDPDNTDPITDSGCSNLFVQGNNSDKQLADIQFNFVTDSQGDLSVGDKVTVTAEVLNINPATSWSGLQLRMIYPCENLKFLKSTPLNGDYLTISISSEKYDNIVGAEIGPTKANFEVGDKLVQFEFEIIKTGNLTLEIADISSIIDKNHQEFSIATNKINL